MGSELSIVIIGRNEEQGIAKCIAAAQIAAEQVGGAEIIFVDSASTDKTAAIAESMGVLVLPMASDLKLCPSAGRYVGSQHVTGEFVLFLDADTLAYKDFLASAIAHFSAYPRVAGVNGYVDDLNENGELLNGVEEREGGVADVKWLRGPACFYRRSALLAAGSFNPVVAMEEEAELGLRLIRAGWELHILPIPMACHTRSYHCQTIASLISTFRRDVMSGRLGEITRTIRVAFEEGNGFAFCWLRLKTTILTMVWLGLLLLTFLLPPVVDLAVFGAIAFGGMLAMYFKKRSLRQAILFTPNKLFCIIDLLAGVPKLLERERGILSLGTIHQPAK